ncbi:thioredoxin [archaeon]|nr:thioredoxin [archaeon]
MSKVISATTESFEEVVLKSEVPVLVDFWATWCGPCKMIAPMLETLSEERTDIRVVKVDVDQNQQLAAKFGIRSIPTLYLFSKGEILASKMGVSSKDALVGWIDSSI